MIFKPISKNIKRQEGNTITKINIKITFKEYVFSRAKTTSNTSAIAYTPPSWVGKTVSIIPMPITITDRYIEKQYNEEKQEYKLTIESDVIYKKTIKSGTNVGRTYIPNELAGLDVLIIESPLIENLY